MAKNRTSNEPSLFDEPVASEALIPPPNLPDDWQSALADEFGKPYFQSLLAFVAEERAKHDVFPPENEVFNAFHDTPLNKVRVLVIGQVSYVTPGDGHGLCFAGCHGVV